VRIVVEPVQLRAAAARLRADAWCLESLLVVARLEAAAAAIPGTELAAAAREAADCLHAAVARARLQMAACGLQLAAAADLYEAADATAAGSPP
jgi:hypothetical protein